MLSRIAEVPEGSSSVGALATDAIEATRVQPVRKTITRTSDATIRCMFSSQAFDVSTFARDEFKLFGQGCKSKWDKLHSRHRRPGRDHRGARFHSTNSHLLVLDDSQSVSDRARAFFLRVSHLRLPLLSS